MKTITMPKDEYDQLVSDNEKLRNGAMVCADVLIWAGSDNLTEHVGRGVIESGADVIPTSAVQNLEVEYNKSLDDIKMMFERKELTLKEKNTKDSLMCFAYGFIAASLIAIALWLS